MTVVVIGGGIVGMASAYYLARDGRDVVVCERNKPGAGSTERALGGIRCQFSTPVNIALSSCALSVWEDFEATFDVDIGFRQHGYLFVTADEETADRFERVVDLQNGHGVPSETLAPASARAYLPELRAERFIEATYSPDDGTADPHLALQGFTASARREGADIRVDTEVIDVGLDGGRVRRVDTRTGSIPCDVVVNAAGPWGGKVAKVAGLDLPISPSRRQIAVVEPSIPYPEDAPLTINLDSGVHFAPEREGDALLGGQFGTEEGNYDLASYPSDYDLDWAATALEHASACAGYFGPNTRVKNGWSGLYAMTPDHHPILEETKPGFVNAVGFSGHGFMHAPATGQVVCDIVRGGDTKIVDLDRLRLDRFDEGGTTNEATVI